MGIRERFWLVILIAGPLAAIAANFSIAKDGCQDKCGNVNIPYPFGTTEGCYYNDNFLITCNDTFDPPLAFIANTEINVTNITLEGRMHILQFIAHDCYDEFGQPIYTSNPRLNVNSNSSYIISHTYNKFVAIGCDTSAYVEGVVQGINGNYTAGCITKCDSIDYVTNYTCSGIGCCKTSIAKGTNNISVTVKSYESHKGVWRFNPCSYGFVVEEGKFNFSSNFLVDLKHVSKLPMVLDWSIREDVNYAFGSKISIKANACQGNSSSVRVDDDRYRCMCFEGFEGNPYLPIGCQDIDECSYPNLNNCTKDMICTNTVGNYSCVAIPNRQHGRRKQMQILVPVGIGGPALFLLAGTWLLWGYNTWKLIKLKQKFSKQNGGLMLQQLLSNHEGSAEIANMFTTEELEKATNSFDESEILGQGGNEKVYKGTLRDGRAVAIKKSHIIDQSQNEQFINEVVELSQINHRNVVKLLGCCLETEVPLLVYESISNGTLHDHIHNKSKASSLTWEIRLRIAAETAKVLSDLHSAASMPIIHGDIKSTNILLDDSYTVKVSNFGTSRFVPQDQAGLSTVVQRTLGYLDPEYLQTNQLTKKSDVYSFGVVLVELLTGEQVLSFDRAQEKRNLSRYFLSAMKDNCLGKILDGCIVNETNIEQLNEVANLARRCLSVKGEERPTMMEVAMELEGLRKMTKPPRVNGASDAEEAEYLPGETSNKPGSEFDVSGSMSVISNTLQDLGFGM